MVHQIFISLILPDPNVIKVSVLEKGEFDQLDDLPALASKPPCSVSFCLGEERRNHCQDQLITTPSNQDQGSSLVSVSVGSLLWKRRYPSMATIWGFFPWF